MGIIGNIIDDGSSGGVDTSDATATAGDIISGETAYGSAGTKITGTATLQVAISDMLWSRPNATLYQGGSTNYMIQTGSGVRYFFYLDNGQEVCYRKSTDNGINWGPTVIVFTGTAQQLTVWYDRWSGIAGDLIHCAYTDAALHATLYRSIDAGNADALSTETTIFNGASAVSGQPGITLARMRGGNLLCRVCIDAGVEGGVYKSTDVGATWGAVTINEALASGDQAIMLPGFAADNQDAILIFWDASANEISRQLYDDSADTWAETSIAASMTELSVGTAWPNFSAVTDLTNSRIVLIAWSNTDTLNADLMCWTVTESAITAKTDVITNSTDDQGSCVLGLNTTTGVYYAFYAGKTDGSQTWPTDVDIFYRTSSDLATWSSETSATSALIGYGTYGALWTIPRFTGPWQIMVEGGTTSDVMIGTPPLYTSRAAA